jgi:hypothetical protein
MWEGSMAAVAPPFFPVLSTPVVSNTSISVQALPLLLCSHQDELMALLPDFHLISKYPLFMVAVEWMAEVV